MTSNCRLFVNITCANINECYQFYPQVNTNLLTSRSLKSVDRSNRLNNKKPKSCRETVSLYPQLGTHHTGLMGSASSKRVFPGAYSSSTSNETNTDNKMLWSGACQNDTRGLRPPDKGDNSRNHRCPQKVMSPNSFWWRRGGKKGL